MAIVFSLMVMPKNKKNYKVLLHFDATKNTEMSIASALYKGYEKIKGEGFVGINTYYIASYFYYTVEDGKFFEGVTDYSLMKKLNLDASLIGTLFEDYKAGRKKPLKLSEVYSFFKKERQSNLKVLKLKNIKGFDYRVANEFFDELKTNSKKYSKKVNDIFNIVYRENYRPEIAMDMIAYPDWLKPIGLKTERLQFNHWKMEAEIDNQLVQYDIEYDSQGISEYGPVGTIELGAKLLESYIKYILMDSYNEFTENSIEYKIFIVTDFISRYLEEIRGIDFRKNYYKNKKAKEAQEFMVDMEDLLRGYRKDERLNKDLIYEVINYLKQNPQELEKYKDNYQMRTGFYPWFTERVSKRQKLFKNVPKD